MPKNYCLVDTCILEFQKNYIAWLRIGKNRAILMGDFFRATNLYDIKYNGFNAKSIAIVNVH